MRTRKNCNPLCVETSARGLAQALHHASRIVPSDSYAWIIRDAIPSFVRFERQLVMKSPGWQIETVSPRCPDEPIH